MNANAMPNEFEQRSRRGVRRTVIVLSVVIGFFYLLSFVQIILLR